MTRKMVAVLAGITRAQHFGIFIDKDPHSKLFNELSAYFEGEGRGVKTFLESRGGKFGVEKIEESRVPGKLKEISHNGVRVHKRKFRLGSGEVFAGVTISGQEIVLGILDTRGNLVYNGSQTLSRTTDVPNAVINLLERSMESFSGSSEPVKIGGLGLYISDERREPADILSAVTTELNSAWLDKDFKIMTVNMEVASAATHILSRDIAPQEPVVLHLKFDPELSAAVEDENVNVFPVDIGNIPVFSGGESAGKLGVGGLVDPTLQEMLAEIKSYELLRHRDSLAFAEHACAAFLEQAIHALSAYFPERQFSVVIDGEFNGVPAGNFSRHMNDLIDARGFPIHVRTSSIASKTDPEMAAILVMNEKMEELYPVMTADEINESIASLTGGASRKAACMFEWDQLFEKFRYLPETSFDRVVIMSEREEGEASSYAYEFYWPKGLSEPSNEALLKILQAKTVSIAVGLIGARRIKIYSERAGVVDDIKGFFSGEGKYAASYLREIFGSFDVEEIDEMGEEAQRRAMGGAVSKQIYILGRAKTFEGLEDADRVQNIAVLGDRGVDYLKKENVSFSGKAVVAWNDGNASAAGSFYYREKSNVFRHPVVVHLSLGTGIAGGIEIITSSGSFISDALTELGKIIVDPFRSLQSPVHDQLKLGGMSQSLAGNQRNMVDIARKKIKEKSGSPLFKTLAITDALLSDDSTQHRKSLEAIKKAYDDLTAKGVGTCLKP